MPLRRYVMICYGCDDVMPPCCCCRCYYARYAMACHAALRAAHSALMLMLCAALYGALLMPAPLLICYATRCYAALRCCALCAPARFADSAPCFADATRRDADARQPGALLRYDEAR